MAFSSHNDRNSFKPALWVKRDRCSLCHGHGGRIESLVHHHSITTSLALSIDNVSAILQPPFGFWFASRQRISIRTRLPSISSFFSTVWLSRWIDVIVLLIAWRATKDLKDPLTTPKIYSETKKYFLKRYILSINTMFHKSIVVHRWRTT